MLHLFHLGPLVAGEGRRWLLSGVREDGGFIHPLVGPDVPSGVATLCARHGAQSLRVEPALEAVGAVHGIHAETLPQYALVPRAVLAFAFLTSHRLFRKPSSVAAFLEACAFFEQAAPWTRFSSAEPFAILMTEAWRCWKREFVVRGASGEPRGLELHERPGFVDGLREAQITLGRIRPPRLDSLLVSFDSAPAWAVQSVRTAYGLGEIPSVIRMKPGSRHPPESLELLQLATALRSAALLAVEDTTPDHGAQVVLSADRHELAALATPPIRAATAGRPIRPVSRNAPCPCGSGIKFKRCHLVVAPTPILPS